MSHQAVFASLVLDEAGHPLEVTTVGGEAHYVIDDAGFRRHVDAEVIDRQVIQAIQAQVNANKEMVEDAIMKMIGKDDLFTKAALDVSIKNMDQAIARGIPEDARMWLGMMGFRVVVNVHGEVIRVDMPSTSTEEE